MLIWSALVTAVLMGLTLGLSTTGAPEWAMQAAELVGAAQDLLLIER
jgi:hypothetical protein